jgi:hypothetical protein
MRSPKIIRVLCGVGLVVTVVTASVTGPAYADPTRDPRPAAGDDKRLPKNQPERGMIYDGLERAPSLCGTGFRLGKSKYCTHGPDPAPSGLNVRKRVAPIVKAGARSPQLAALCDGDGESGLRTQVLYVRASDVPDRYADYVASFRVWAEGASAIYDASAAETGGSRHIRFVHDGSCEISVAHVVIPPEADDEYWASAGAVAALGYDRTDRKYMMFVDAFVYCGVANFNWTSDEAGPDNASNSGPGWGRTDAGCWSSAVAAHEHMHNLGGVQLSAPHTSGGAHCFDDYDLMCYKDAPTAPDMQILCADGAHESRFDCNHDDYYNTNPPAGSYLRTHWNAADSLFLIGGAQWGYVWANDPFTESTYTPSQQYQRNSTGALNTITRSGVGAYTVQFTNLSRGSGTVNVTAYGISGHTCKVGFWYPSGGHQYVDVRCFDSAGNAADTSFNASFTAPVQNPGDIGYVWADQPSASTYTPSPWYQFNSTGATNTVDRLDVGNYHVRMPGLGAAGYGHVKVTAYGTWDASACSVGYWTENLGERVINVRCHDAAGNPVDTYYTVTYVNALSVLGVTGAAAAYVWAYSPTQPSYVAEGPYTFNSTGGANSIVRNATGDYTVHFAGLAGEDGHVQVTGYGGSSHRCKVGWWGGAWNGDLIANVQCTNVSGGQVDTLFAASFTR